VTLSVFEDIFGADTALVRAAKGILLLFGDLDVQLVPGIVLLEDGAGTYNRADAPSGLSASPKSFAT
jgi:hypothetical protein